MNKNLSAFTLIELSSVIVIIGILIAGVRLILINLDTTNN